MFETNARGILLDIEGTTSSISFVYDVMFPYVREHVAEFLRTQWIDADVQSAIEVLAKDCDQHSVSQWLGDRELNDQQSVVVAGIIGLMDADIKATGLKRIQGLIWKSGFHSGQMVAHLYPEVASCIRSWNAAGLDVRIYSSGSIQAQKLFFGHTVAGDLLGELKGHYDTTTGAKQESESYQKIAREFGLEAEQILFVSDVVAELEAAQKAGMQAVLSMRPGNKPVDDDHGFQAIGGFDEIQLAGGVKG